MVYGNYVKMDIANKAEVDEVFSKVKPDAVVHAATLTDVDKCESNKGLAWKINVDGTLNIVEACNRLETFLGYISTDYVFSGEKGCYVESDSPEPVNYYGTTKLEAETVVASAMAASDFFIARPSVIYGSTPAAGKVNFALWLIEALSKGNHVKIVKDQWNTPTLNTNLADMTLEAVERRLTGIYHLCGATRVSRLEFARKIAEAFDLNKDLIEPVTSQQFILPAKRPTDSSLDTSKAQRTLENKPLQLDAALAQLKLELTQKPA